MAEKKPRIHIGTQGWNYDAWVGPFFPINTRPADFLAVYSRAFSSVEVDSTFYGVPAPATFQSWYDRTPHDFVFTLNLPRNPAAVHERDSDVPVAKQRDHSFGKPAAYGVTDLVPCARIVVVAKNSDIMT